MKTNTQASKEPIVQIVGANMRKRRLAIGLTQQDVAQVLGIEVETVSRYERGHIAPPIEQLSRIAEALSIPTWTLLAAGKENRASTSLALAEQMSRLSDQDIATLAKIIKAYVDAHGSVE